MVRNQRGGNKNRRGARKNHHEPISTALRKAVIEGEMYARVTKIFGGGMADVLCNDGIVRLLVIRRSFRGRNKRDNFVALNSVVLVGIRQWEVVAVGKKSKADLLYIYSKSQVYELKKLEDFNGILLPEDMADEDRQEGGIQIKAGGGGDGFDNGETMELIAEDTPANNIIIGNGEEISFDDI
jgi:initiation factor 1A